MDVKGMRNRLIISFVACMAVFSVNAMASDSTFTAVLGKHELSGTYEYDSSTHVVTLRFAKGKLNLGAVEGHAYVSGTELQLVFPVTKLVNLVTELGSRVSSLSTITALLKKYENVYLGFAFTK